ncbi:MAG: ABC transporter ATP-binding protein/permease [Fretibacterium sp.]|nr:ABC transporter ATP-binding protein/permease [Fretibacterium sp.]
MILRAEQREDRRSAVRKLAAWTAPHRWRLAEALVFMLFSSLLNSLPPWLFKSVVDDVLISRDLMKLNLVCIAVIVIFAVKAVTLYWQQYLMSEVGQNVVMDIRLALYDHMQRMSLRTLYASRVGDLMSRITGDVATLQNLVTNTAITLAFNAVTFLGMFGFILYINWRLTLLIVVILPVIAWLLSFAARRLRKAGHNVQEQLANLTAIAQEAFSAIRVVRSFATEDQELDRFRRGNMENFKALLQAVSIQAFLAGVIEVFLICALAVVFWLGGRTVLDGELTPGELIAFIGYIAFMVQPIRTVMNSMGGIQTSLAAADRIFDMLDTPLEGESVPFGGSAGQTDIEPGKIRGEAVFEDVHFSYVEGQEILRGISLTVSPGERVAIVGPTGSGKSTLVDLIPRFYDPTAGRVLIDGRDVRTLRLPSLRRQIGIVPQDCVLMRGSIAFNIAYGLAEDGPELFRNAELMERVREAARVADIAGFIEEQPDKYAAEVGERGVTLSGGQRQRIAIARAIVRDPRILILDEATSSLDLAVERQVQEAMNRAMAGRTSFIIAHRLSTVRSADRILVLKDGLFAEEGSHDSLLRAGGLYAELYRIQSGPLA